MSENDTEDASTANIELAAGLRAATAAYIGAVGLRRVLPAIFHVGKPGGRPGERWAVPDESRYDSGLRADLVEQALDMVDVERPCPWLTRGGELVPTDVDFAWLAASRVAFARLELEMPGFFVITRRGWVNLMTENVLPHTGIRPRRRRRRA